MIHQSHPEVLARLRRAQGHLATVIQMIEAGRPCADLAQQLHAVEKAIGNAKRGLIQDHIDHCLDGAVARSEQRIVAALDVLRAVTETLAHVDGKTSLVTRSTVWKCGDGVCTAGKANTRDNIMCELVAREVGQLSAFRANGTEFDAEALAKCNTKAR